MQKRYKRLFSIFVLFSMCAMSLIVWTSAISANIMYEEASHQTRTLTVNALCARGNIYDCNMKILNNTDVQKNAIILPTQESVDLTAPYTLNYKDYYEKVMTGKPFCTKISYGDYFCEDVHVFDIMTQNTENKFATHIIGYCNDENEGISGLEFAYNDILKQYSLENSVTYSVDGSGSVILGEKEYINLNESVKGGIVTTLDYDMQEICLDAAKGKIEKGTIIVMDINNGDIKAMASFPTYSYSEIESAMSNENSPMINRALYSYSVGSIFKLVISAAAIDCKLEDFIYECKGYTTVGSQTFKCHDPNGHGEQTMCDAVINSCNPYFIELCKKIDGETLRSYALSFGFYDKIELAKSISSMQGTVPNVQELLIPAEKANFAFGQGVLTATPLQICRMTCGIASFGEMPEPRLVLGTTSDGISIENEMQATYSYCVSVSTARKLRDFMDAVVTKNEDSPAKAFNTTCAVKTSTAQTGRYDENGVEYCHAWITGYFPAQKPKYAVTVLVEDGGYGNDAAAPIFKYIAEEITALEDLRLNGS